VRRSILFLRYAGLALNETKDFDRGNLLRKMVFLKIRKRLHRMAQVDSLSGLSDWVRLPRGRGCFFIFRTPLSTLYAQRPRSSVFGAPREAGVFFRRRAALADLRRKLFSFRQLGSFLSGNLTGVLHELLY
jgi:hypothetical protein